MNMNNSQECECGLTVPHHHPEPGNLRKLEIIDPCGCACHENKLGHPYGHTTVCCLKMNGYIENIDTIRAVEAERARMIEEVKGMKLAHVQADKETVKQVLAGFEICKEMVLYRLSNPKSQEHENL
jgi:hypothetical protein